MGRPADHRGAVPAGRRQEGKDFTMGKLNEQYTSSLQLAVAILGGKWKLRILMVPAIGAAALYGPDAPHPRSLPKEPDPAASGVGGSQNHQAQGLCGNPAQGRVLPHRAWTPPSGEPVRAEHLGPRLRRGGAHHRAPLGSAPGRVSARSIAHSRQIVPRAKWRGARKFFISKYFSGELCSPAQFAQKIFCLKMFLMPNKMPGI